MSFCIAGSEELDALLGVCPLCGRPVTAAELELQEERHYSTTRIKTNCLYCQVTFDIEARTWDHERKYGAAFPAIDIWNKLSSQGKPRPAALDKIRTRYEVANGVDKAILREVLEILEE